MRVLLRFKLALNFACEGSSYKVFRARRWLMEVISGQP
jgi:hypothetical protein